MKKVNCLLAALAIGMFTSCTNDEGPEILTEKTAKLEISIAGTSNADSKATGSVLPTVEDSIRTIAVGVFNGNTVNLIRAFSAAEIAAKKASINVSPGVCTIVVVANVPNGTFGGVNSKPVFYGKMAQLIETASAPSSEGTQMSNNLPMSGQAIDVTLAAGTTVAQTINISRMVSRVSIGSIQTSFDPSGAYKDASLSITGIFLHNAKSACTVNPDQYLTSVIISGQSGGISSYLFHTLSQTLTNGIAYTTPYWFYTFPNDATTPTKLVIKGLFKTNSSDAGTVVYYPIVVNKTQLGTTLTGGTDGMNRGNSTIGRNTTYTLSATIKGKGTDSADADLEPALLDLTVGVSPWALNITQDVIFD